MEVLDVYAADAHRRSTGTTGGVRMTTPKSPTQRFAVLTLALPSGDHSYVIFDRQTARITDGVYFILDLAMVARGTALDIGVIKAARDEHAGDVVVASVQTLQREARLQRLAQTFDLIVVDECHHALPDNSYGRILAHVGADQTDGPLTVG